MIWSDAHGPEDGPLVVLVHGSMDRAAGMLRLARALSDRCRVLRYDRRGYGRSVPHEHGHPVPHPGPFGIEAQVADLVEVLADHHAGRPAVVMGHSYGGNVALALADRHPELVRAVAVYESPLSWEPWWPGTTAGGAARSGGDDPAGAAERFMRRLIGDARWDELPPGTKATRRREGGAMVGELSDIGTNRPWHAERILVPVRCGSGTNGAPHHQEGMRRAAAMLPDATLVELPGCGHDAPMAHPALFAREMVLPLV